MSSASFIHQYLPSQQIISEDKLQKVLNDKNIRKEQLPSIFSNDPVASSLEAKPGDVIKSSRISLVTRKEEPYYRLVVESPEE